VLLSQFVADPLTGLYSHVGIVLRGGSVVCITSSQQKLSYHMVYLPGSVEGYCPVKDGIMATDGLDLWHSKLTWSNGGQPAMENSVMGIKGVCALDVFPDTDAIIVVTVSTVKMLQHLTHSAEPDGVLSYNCNIFAQEACSV